MWNLEAALFQVEFVCNSMVNRYTSRAPFEIFYTCSLHHICDMAIIPLVAGERSKTTDNVAAKVFQIHVEVRAQLETANAKYKAGVDKHRHNKVFQEGDLVIFHLWRSRFPSIHAIGEAEAWFISCSTED